MMSRFAPLLRRFTAARTGVAAIEMALLAPVILLFTAMLVDLGYSYNVKLKVVAATGAAAQYAYFNGQSLTSVTVPAFLTNVQNVVKAQAGLSVTPTVTVLYNNAADGSNASNYYCVAGYGPSTWTSTGTSSGSCGGSVTSGKFVSISVSLNLPPLLSPYTLGGSATAIGDFVIVRVR